jgi:hypothetical protein
MKVSVFLQMISNYQRIDFALNGSILMVLQQKLFECLMTQTKVLQYLFESQ